MDIPWWSVRPVNSAAVARPELVREAAEAVGSQSVVIAIDVKRTLLRAI